jgi:hypothetical protein
MSADFKQSANLAGKILASGQVAAAATNTTVYTVPASSAVKVATFSLTNVTGSPVTVTVSVVPNAGSVDGTHQVVSAYPLAANDSTVVSEVAGAMLDTGAFIVINASAVTAIDYLLTGAVAS